MKCIALHLISMPFFLLSCAAYSLETGQHQSGSSSDEIAVVSKEISINKLLFSNSDISSEKIINSTGGVATLENVVSVSFVEKALPNHTKVILSAGHSNDIDDAFNDATVMFGAIKRLSQEVKINTGKEPPASEYVSTKIYIGNFLSYLQVSELSVFIGFEQGSQEEALTMAFDTVEYSYNPQEKALMFNIPGAAFTANELTGKEYQAIIILAVNKSHE